MLIYQYIQALKAKCVFQTTFICREAAVIFLTNSSVQYEWLKYYFFPHYSYTQSDCQNLAPYHVYALEEKEAFRTICHFLHSLSGTLTPMYAGREGIFYTYGYFHILLEQDERTIAIACEGETSLLFLTDPDCEFSYLDTARVVREVMTKLLEVYQFYLFHAGAVELDRQVVLFCGNKGAGKTTSIISALARQDPRFRFISNDRVYIGHRQDRFCVLGFPTALTIGAGTIKNYPQLLPYAFNPRLLRYPQNEPWLEKDILNMSSEELWRMQSKLIITLQEIGHIFARDLVSDLPLAALVFPELDITSCSQEKITRLSSQEVEKALQEMCFTPFDKEWPDWLRIRRQSEEELDEASHTLIRAISEQIPAYRLQFKEGASAVSTFLQAVQF